MKNAEHDRILIDAGTSTTKVYTYFGGKLTHEKNYTMFLSQGFEPAKGISNADFEALCGAINTTKEKYSGTQITVFGTAIFRKHTKEALARFVKDFKEKTGEEFKVISHEEENTLLEEAFLEKIPSEKVLLINIGGGSTELVLMEGKKSIERANIDLGVGSVMKQFPAILDEETQLKAEDIMHYAEEKIPTHKDKIKTAFYTGGELSYMRTAKYPLIDNSSGSDSEHPQKILFDEFAKRNAEIFATKMSELKEMMPHNPDWMKGARACSALAQAICKKYGIKEIIPSDLNLMNGIAKRIEKGKEI